MDDVLSWFHCHSNKMILVSDVSVFLKYIGQRGNELLLLNIGMPLSGLILEALHFSSENVYKVNIIGLPWWHSG